MGLTVYLKYYHTKQKRNYKRKIYGPSENRNASIRVALPEKAEWGQIEVINSDGKDYAISVSYSVPNIAQLSYAGISL